MDIEKKHNDILQLIQIELIGIERDINIQIDSFYKKSSYKLYRGIRNDKGYQRWKHAVVERFGNCCAVCFSSENLVAHHLYSYKYYEELRTELNNGVCICNTCHELFNDLYSNVNTLGQFIEYRELFKGVSHLKVREYISQKRIIKPHEKPLKKLVKKAPLIKKVKQTYEEQTLQNSVIFAFEELRQKLVDEHTSLLKEYGYEKGIKIDFRTKSTTSLSAISKLHKEIMRLNTLISCNKMRDKSVMAEQFHMSLSTFCKRIQDTNEYLNYTDSEITHLNMILSKYYADEYRALNKHR